MALAQTWLDRAVGAMAPRWQLSRLKARMAIDLVQRHFEAAGNGRRQQNWYRASTDPNLANWTSLARLRDVARDLVRNNSHAESALATIGDHVVGTGIVAKSKNARALAAWKAWAETTDCDADGRHDIYGLQKLIMTSVAEAGEVLVRRRPRLLSDGLAIPLQLQVLEADFLDTPRTMPLPNGGSIIQGIEFDAIGNRVAYWLYPRHPGSVVTVNATMFGMAKRIPASEIVHIFKAKRPGQVRAVSWFAPVLLRFKDFDEVEDATVMKQKIAACLAVITSDLDGTASPIGTADDTATPVPIDTLEPGAIMNVPPGRSVSIVQPPSTTDYGPFCNVTLRAIATGLGVSYEDLTGDYTNLPFSAARMSRIRHWARVDDWRYRLIIPQFCTPAWNWAMQMAEISGVTDATKAGVQWTAPPPPVLDPAAEGMAIQRIIRSGTKSQSEAIREAGYDPDELFKEIAEDNKKMDALGIVLDSDARQTTQHGMAQIILPPGEAKND